MPVLVDSIGDSAVDEDEPFDAAFAAWPLRWYVHTQEWEWGVGRPVSATRIVSDLVSRAVCRQVRA